MTGAPVALFSSENHICPGTCVDFTNLSSNANSFEWTFAGANPSTSTDVNPTAICYTTPGTYSVSLIASGAGGSDTVTLNNYITVYPYPPPQGIQQVGDTLFANQGATTYQWYYNGTMIPGATDYFYVATQYGDYNITCTDANGCEVEAAAFGVMVGLSPTLIIGDGINLYPNPVIDILGIFIPIAIGMKSGNAVDISIYNLLGERVYASANCLTTSTGILTIVPIAIGSRLLSSGMYSLEIISEQKIFRGKFVKQ